jgi:hypothetical protein
LRPRYRPDDHRAAECGKLPDCGAPAQEQVIGLAGAGDAGIGTVILIGDHEYVCEDRDARRVREDPAAPVHLVGDMRATGLMEREDGHAGMAGGRRGEEDEQA